MSSPHVFNDFSICDHFIWVLLVFPWFDWFDVFIIWIISPMFFVFCFVCFFCHASPPAHTHQLSNGFDHYSPENSPYLHSNGGSLGSGSSTAFPFFPVSSSSSTSSSSPTRSWSRPTSALLPDYPPYCTLGPMIPSSRVPSWKVCSLTWVFTIISSPSSLSPVWTWWLLTVFSSQDWAKPGPYDQPMVNTLRRKKDKEPMAVPDFNGSMNDSSLAMTLTHAPPALQTSISVEERTKPLNPPVKVRVCHKCLFHEFYSSIRNASFVFCPA